MDPTTAAVMVVVLFALIAVAAFFVFRRQARLRIRGPLDTELEIDASNEPTPPAPGVRVKDAVSRGGGLLAEDKTGRGADVEGVEVQDDILVSSSTPPQGNAGKKGPPPA